MYVRKKKNKSGTISVQVIDTSGSHDRLVKTIGSSKDPDEVNALIKEGYTFIEQSSGQHRIHLNYFEDKDFLSHLAGGLSKVELAGPELILGKIFNEIGFNQIEDDLFRHLVISRLIFPLSKLKTSEYLLRYQGINIDVDTIYRYLDKIQEEQKELIQQISFDHTVKLFNGDLSIVFYDVTTLYFEASDEDDLRKTGFSKDGKHQNPQIVLGLLVSLYGYPLAFDIFEGNKFEGYTMLPIVEGFKKKFNLQKLLIIADAGLLSKANISQLIEKGYEFILGGRIKNEPEKIKKEVLSKKYSNGDSHIITRDENTRLIVAYSSLRERKDARNRQIGLNKLEKAMRNGKLNKQHVNKRGYNKYLKLDGEINVSIDYEKFKADNCWDGLKGYITNSKLSKEAIIDNYRHLWQIEKAFRISKTDLRIRPIYHRLPKRISAHIVIAFTAYKVYKELERQLKDKKSDLSPEKTLDLMKTIYRIKVKLPKSAELVDIIFAQDEKQQHILKLFNINTSLD